MRGTAAASAVGWTRYGRAAAVTLLTIADVAQARTGENIWGIILRGTVGWARRALCAGFEAITVLVRTTGAFVRTWAGVRAHVTSSFTVILVH